MDLGLQFTNFTHTKDPALLGQTLGELATLAEQVGYDRLTILDHHWQNSFFGDPGDEMLEPYATLAFLAAHTSKVKLLTIVTNPLLRTPPMLARTVSTVDALSGGRVILGVGAGSHQGDVEAAGVVFPDAAERMARFDEALRLILQMWSDDDGPFDGEYYHSTSTMLSPIAIGRPRPRILIGGHGEKKLLRLVAKYADEYNFSNGHSPVDEDLVERKLTILKQHCDEVGTDYDAILKTGNVFMNVGDETGSGIPQIIEDIEAFSRHGIEVVHGTLSSNGKGIPPDKLAPYIEMFGERVIPRAAQL